MRKIEPTQAEEIVALIAGVRSFVLFPLKLADNRVQLPKKERALCLFNPEHLRTKVADALEVLASSSDDETPAPAPTPPAIVTPPPSTSLPTPTMPIQVTPSIHASSILVPTSLAELGRLPATEIMELVAAGSLGSLGIVRASEEKESETGAFMVTLEGKPAHEIKQKLGDRLFKAIKGFGVKGAVSRLVLASGMVADSCSRGLRSSCSIRRSSSRCRISSTTPTSSRRRSSPLSLTNNLRTSPC